MKGGAEGQPPLLPFDRRGKRGHRGQSALFIKVPLKLTNCTNQRDSYAIPITQGRNKMAVSRKKLEKIGVVF